MLAPVPEVRITFGAKIVVAPVVSWVIELLVAVEARVTEELAPRPEMVAPVVINIEPAAER